MRCQKSKLSGGRKRRRRTRITIRQSEKESREENETRVLSSAPPSRDLSSGGYKLGLSEMGRGKKKKTEAQNKSSNAAVIEDAFHLVLAEALGIVNQKCARQGANLYLFIYFLMGMMVRWICLSHSVRKLH